MDWANSMGLSWGTTSTGDLPSLESRFSGFPVESLYADAKEAGQLSPVSNQYGSIVDAAAKTILYGFTRKIDNMYGPPGTVGNVSGGSGGGQGGTYSQTAGKQSGGGNLLMLLIVGLVVFEVLD